MNDKTITIFFAAVLVLGAWYLSRPAPAQETPQPPGPVTPQAEPQFMTVEYTVS